MDRTIRTTTVVLPGGRIELASPDLQTGARVDVTIVQGNGDNTRSLADVLAAYKGGSLFKSAAEVDEYLKQERDSWLR